MGHYSEVVVPVAIAVILRFDLVVFSTVLYHFNFSSCKFLNHLLNLLFLAVVAPS